MKLSWFVFCYAVIFERFGLVQCHASLVQWRLIGERAERRPLERALVFAHIRSVGELTLELLGQLVLQRVLEVHVKRVFNNINKNGKCDVTYGHVGGV